jgi:hypothetical protein
MKKTRSKNFVTLSLKTEQNFESDNMTDNSGAPQRQHLALQAAGGSGQGRPARVPAPPPPAPPTAAAAAATAAASLPSAAAAYAQPCACYM